MLWPCAPRGRDRCLKALSTSQVGQGLLSIDPMKQGKIEFPPKPQPEHIELLIEFLTAFQRVLCAKAFNLVKALRKIDPASSNAQPR